MMTDEEIRERQRRYMRYVDRMVKDTARRVRGAHDAICEDSEGPLQTWGLLIGLGLITSGGIALLTGQASQSIAASGLSKAQVGILLDIVARLKEADDHLKVLRDDLMAVADKYELLLGGPPFSMMSTTVVETVAEAERQRDVRKGRRKPDPESDPNIH